MGVFSKAENIVIKPLKNVLISELTTTEFGHHLYQQLLIHAPFTDKNGLIYRYAVTVFGGNALKGKEATHLTIQYWREGREFDDAHSRLSVQFKMVNGKMKVKKVFGNKSYRLFFPRDTKVGKTMSRGEIVGFIKGITM